MKLKKSIAFVLILLLLSSMAVIQVFAVGSSLSGPSTVKKGQTITVSLLITGAKNIQQANGSLSYNSSQVEFLGGSAVSGWTGAVGSTFNVYDGSGGGNAINGTGTVLTATFRVKASSGKISISASGISVSDGESDKSAGSATYTATVQKSSSSTKPKPSSSSSKPTPSTSGTQSNDPQPNKSDNANLKSLTVSNAELSPAFSAGVTEYTATVPYDVEKLTINAVPADSKASVSVQNNKLTPDAVTPVKVVVTAENGSQKIYQIKVTRQKDPNYKGSDDNTLASLEVDSGVLSPKFDPERGNYVVWLPYETKSLKVTAKAADDKAQGVKISGGETLLENRGTPVTVTVTAENGDQRVYTIVAKRALDPSIDPSLLAEPLKTQQDILTLVQKLGEKGYQGEIPAALERSAMGGELIKALQKYPNVKLNLMFDGASVLLAGSDFTNAVPDKEFGLSYSSPSEKAAQLKAKAGEGAFTYSFGNASLPGEFLYRVKTPLKAGEMANIYGLDENGALVEIKQGVIAGDGGVITYRSSFGGDCAVTAQTIANAAALSTLSNESPAPNGPFGWLNSWASVGIIAGGVLLVGGGLGALLCWLIIRRKSARRVSGSRYRP